MALKCDGLASDVVQSKFHDLCRYHHERWNAINGLAAQLNGTRGYDDDGHFDPEIAKYSVTRLREFYRQILRKCNDLAGTGLDSISAWNLDVMQWDAAQWLQGLELGCHYLWINHINMTPTMVMRLCRAELEGKDEASSPLALGRSANRLRSLVAWLEELPTFLERGIESGVAIRPRVAVLASKHLLELAREFGEGSLATLVEARGNVRSARTVVDVIGLMRTIVARLRWVATYLQGSYLHKIRVLPDPWTSDTARARYEHLCQWQMSLANSIPAVATIAMSQLEASRDAVNGLQASRACRSHLMSIDRTVPLLQARANDICRLIHSRAGAFFDLSDVTPFAVNVYIWNGTGPREPHYTPGSASSARPAAIAVPITGDLLRLTESLSTILLHEGIPGHHLQRCLAQMRAIPSFRDNIYIPGFSEGWAVYAESLGKSLGAFATPSDLIGFHRLQMMRAMRALADIGINYHDRPAFKMIEEIQERYHCSRAEARSMVYRCMALPGQALSYIAGSHYIDGLARRAASNGALSREFHHHLLAQGEAPLTLLGKRLFKQEKINPQ